MEQTGEKLEFLKREEIRTMSKDMARSREKDAKQERERILKLQEEKKLKLQVPAPVTPKVDERPEKIALSPSLHSPSSKIEKIFIRVVIVVIILFLLGNIAALSYYIFWKKTGQKIPPPTKQQEVSAPEPEPTPEPQPSPSPASLTPFRGQASLIQENTSISLEYDEISQIPGILSQSLQQVLNPGFTRILLRRHEEYISPSILFEAFSVLTPQELAPTLGSNMTPFLFSSNGKNHLGFVIEASDQKQTSTLMRSWEPTFERDTEPLFAIMGKKGAGYTSLFRQRAYTEIPIRFQTFSRQDFGIVYALFHNRLLLTGSLESMEALITNISTQ